MMEFEDQLASAMRSTVDTLRPPPVSQLVAGGVQRGRRLRRRRRLVTAGAAAVVVLLGIGAGVAVGRDGAGTSTTAGPGSCRSVVRTDVLPVWARAGFSEPRPRVPHVMSARGDMTAILFGPALYAPPSNSVNNKVLWAARRFDGPLTPLRIDAVRAGTTTHVRRQVPGGPGPSLLNLPQAGCWHLELSWGSRRDSIDLVYATP